MTNDEYRKQGCRTLDSDAAARIQIGNRQLEIANDFTLACNDLFGGVEFERYCDYAHFGTAT